MTWIYRVKAVGLWGIFFFLGKPSEAEWSKILYGKGNLTFLGSTSTPIFNIQFGLENFLPGRRSSQEVQADTLYFRSSNAAGFAAAESDCKAFLGREAHLAYIETKEVLGNLTRFFQSSDDTGSIYWVGGMYDEYSNAFEWGNGAKFGPWLPWEKYHPASKTVATRVAVRPIRLIKFRTEFSTTSYRYLCELRRGPREERALPCYNDNDLVIVVDASGSVGGDHFLNALEFATRLAVAWADNPNNRLSLVVYATSAQTMFTLTDKISTSSLRDRIFKTPYFAGSTSSDLALVQAHSEFKNKVRSVRKNIVFLTDGDSNDKEKTKAAAKAIKDAGIRSFSVGIGTGIRQEELISIAGDDPGRVFRTDGFADLLKLLLPVSESVCQ